MHSKPPSKPFKSTLRPAPSLLPSLPHLFSGCLISPPGSRRAKTIVSLFSTGPSHFATIINTFSNAPFQKFILQTTLTAITHITHRALCFWCFSLTTRRARKPLLPVVEVTALGTEKGGTTWAECLKHAALQQLCLKGLLETAVRAALVIMHLFKFFGTTKAITLTY